MICGGDKTSKKLAIGVTVAVIAIFLFIPIIPVDVTYSETEPYSRLAEYEVVSAFLREGWDFTRGTYHTSEVTIKNIDSYGGTFTVTHDTETFMADFDTQWLQDVRGEYTVSAPTVIDERVVIKHKTVYKSIIAILIYG